MWPKGVNVKHVKGLFKAEGINNTAEPGNPMHSKFYVSRQSIISALRVLDLHWNCLNQQSDY